MANKFKREFKNVVYNYSDAESKVREATSNDPWGPSSALMGELAEYTYHVQAYSLVMGMLWKRLNDHGRNWRHVYKSLVVLEYLIKSGSERVLQQCKDNIFSIQTLKDFQYVDKDGKDQGTNIREKAKQLVALLKDDKRLKEERVRAHQARERQEGVGNDSPRVRTERRVQFQEEASAPEQTPEGKKLEQNVEQARPTDESEEELQLRLALQLSKQQADEEEKVRQQEEDSLKVAIALSEAESKQEEEEEEEKGEGQPEEGGGGDLLLDLNSSGLYDPWAPKITEAPPSYDDVAGGVALNDPWFSFPATANLPAQDPFAPVNMQPSAPLASDPWAPAVSTTALFAPQATTQPLAPTSTASLNPFDLSGLSIGLPPTKTSPGGSPVPPRVEDSFLGTNSNLVDLDLLLPQPPQKSYSSGTVSPINPFGTPPVPHKGTNPFEANKPVAPTLMQLAQANQGYPSGDLLPPPLIPVAGQTASSQLFPSQPLAPQQFGPPRNQSPNPFS